MSHKMFQQQWVLDPVWASDMSFEVKKAVRDYMGEDSGNNCACKTSLRDLHACFEDIEHDYDHHHCKIIYDYIKSVAPELPNNEQILIYNWW